MTTKEKLKKLDELKKELAHSYVAVRKGPAHLQHKDKLQPLQVQLQRSLKNFYKNLLKRIGPLDDWSMKAHDLRPVKKAYAAGTVAQDQDLQQQIYEQMLDDSGLDDLEDSDFDDVDEDLGQIADTGAGLSLLALGAGAALAARGLLAGKTDSQPTADDIQSAWEDSLSGLRNDTLQQIADTGKTTLKAAAGLVVNATDPDTDINPDTMGDVMQAVIQRQSQLVAQTTVDDLTNSVDLLTMKANGVSQKRWISFESACQTCSDNSDADWIDVDEDFPSGDSAPTAHPNCVCELDSKSEDINPDDLVGPEEE